jgi:hypothetical protein
MDKLLRSTGDQGWLSSLERTLHSLSVISVSRLEALSIEAGSIIHEQDHAWLHLPASRSPANAAKATNHEHANKTPDERLEKRSRSDRSPFMPLSLSLSLSLSLVRRLTSWHPPMTARNSASSTIAFLIVFRLTVSLLTSHSHLPHPSLPQPCLRQMKLVQKISLSQKKLMIYPSRKSLIQNLQQLRLFGTMTSLSRRSILRTCMIVLPSHTSTNHVR